jgi:phosphoglycolate phosphatase
MRGLGVGCHRASIPSAAERTERRVEGGLPGRHEGQFRDVFPMLYDFPMSAPRPLVLFDVDGTLMLSGGAGMRAMRTAAADLFGAEFRWDGIVVSGHLDPLIFAEAATLNGLNDDPRHHESFRSRYLEELRGELVRGRAQVRAMPGMHESIARLRAGDMATLGLLTGNYSEAIPLKFAAVDLEPSWFEITAFGEEAPTRRDLAALAIAKYARHLGAPVDPRHIVVVGDTPRDVDCAHAHGCFAFAVATGGYRERELAEAGADLVVHDLADPSPLLDAVARLVAAP